MAGKPSDLENSELEKRRRLIFGKTSKTPPVTKKHQSGTINYRWTPNSEKGRKRGELIGQLCYLYQLEPTPHLIDRLLKDITLLEEYRAKRQLEKIEIEKELKGLG